MRMEEIATSVGVTKPLLYNYFGNKEQQLYAKIPDIFEGTQQIQLLIVARQLLGKGSAELR